MSTKNILKIGNIYYNSISETFDKNLIYMVLYYLLKIVTRY